MGNAAGFESLGHDEIHGIAQFNERDIKRLYNRFRALDADGSGQLDATEIFAVAELNENPLVQRVISVFDADNNGMVLQRHSKRVMLEPGSPLRTQGNRW